MPSASGDIPALDDLDPVHSLRKIYWAVPFYPILFIYTVNWRARNEYYPCLSHVSLGSNDFEAAAAFYDRALAALGCRRVLEHPGAIGYGRDYPEFWLQVPIDGRPASPATARTSAFRDQQATGG